jgi:opacity protein-like surface antigen
MRRFAPAGFIALIALTETQAARAQDYDRPGVYAALNGVASVPLSDLSRDETGIGASGRFGYRASPHLAAEMQVEYTGDHGFGDQHQTLVTVNGKLYATTGRFQPYGVVGLGATFPSNSLRNDSVSFAFRAGAGLDAYLTERVGLLLEATYFRPSDSGVLDGVSIGWGLFYRWGALAPKRRGDRVRTACPARLRRGSPRRRCARR